MAILDNINVGLYRENIDALNVWGAVQPELNAQESEILRVFNNTRVSLSDIEGVEKWERALSIYPDLVRDTIDERRDRVLELLRTKPPLTEAWMHAEIARRFDPLAVFALLTGLSLQIFADAAAVGVNEKGFAKREFVELIRWFRTWIPSNVLISTKSISRRDDVALPLYTGGAGFRVSRRYAKISMPEPKTATLKLYTGGAGFRVSRRASVNLEA